MAGRWLMALMFCAGGVLHFMLTPVYLRTMPPWLPAPRALIFISGACEVLGGVGLLVPPVRRAAAWGLVALLIAVWPANVQMALEPWKWPNVPGWALWFRVAAQLPLIWWAWLYTRDI